MTIMSLFDEFPPQDSFYGLSWSNVVSRLTLDNWETTAVFRMIEGHGLVYLWIRRHTSGDAVTYRVRSHAWQPVPDVEATFPAIEDAIGYINGEDGGHIAKSSRKAKRSEWPGDHQPNSIVGGITPRQS